jgi:hypothetical protein
MGHLGLVGNRVLVSVLGNIYGVNLPFETVREILWSGLATSRSVNGVGLDAFGTLIGTGERRMGGAVGVS